MPDVSRWISVEDRLPPPDHRVLVTTSSRDPARGLIPRKECCEAIAIHQDGTVDRYESDWWWDASQCDFDDEAGRATVSAGWYEYILNQPIPIGGDNLICPEFYDRVTYWMPLPQVPGRKGEYYA